MCLSHEQTVLFWLFFLIKKTIIIGYFKINKSSKAIKVEYFEVESSRLVFCFALF